MRGLNGKHVVVAGGASGMGFAACTRLREEGARVSILDRDVSAVRGAVSSDAHVEVFEADIVEPQSLAAAFTRIVEWGGTVSAAINTAGRGFSAPIETQTIEQFRQIYDVNVFGMYNLIKIEADHLSGAGGVIVNFASTNAVQPAESLSAYASSKAAVESLTQVAAMELTHKGIRVVGVGPALTNTPMTQRFLADDEVRAAFTDNILIGRPAEPAEIAAVAVFLVSDDASYLTGQTIYVDGGSLLMRYPTLAERSGSRR